MRYLMKHNSELLLFLWNHCNNRCSFCYNQTYYHLPLNVKEHLSICNDILNSNFIENFNYLRFLGGELFDGGIHKLNVEFEFQKILDSTLNLLKNDKIERLNLLTNLIYNNIEDLQHTIDFFDQNGMLNRLDLSTSYDWVGRFTKETEKWWWNNINWILNTYKNVKIDIGVIMTQPLITNITKEWLDGFFIKTQHRCNIRFNELDTAIIKNTKENSPFKMLFPKRLDFIKFLKNLKDWNYYDLLGVEPGGINPWNRTLSMQYVRVGEFDFPIFKNLSYLLDEREDFRQDGYIDSDIPLFTDIKKIMEL